MTWQAQKRTITLSGPDLPAIIGREYGGEEVRTPMLTARSVVGHEAVGELYEYKVIAEVAHPDWLADPRDAAQIDLEQLVGTPGTIAIQLTGIGTWHEGQAADRGRSNIGADIRHISGNIAAAEFRCVEDRVAIYEFVLRPSVYDATLNCDSRIFSGNVVDVIDSILGRYGAIDWRIGGPWGGRKTYPPRDFIRQAWESDWTLAMRLMEEWGLFFWFEHAEHRHTLVISDTLGGFQCHGVAYEKLRFHAGGRIDEEHISELAVTYTRTAGRAVVSDHDYTQPRIAKSIVPNREEYEDSRGTASRRIERYEPGDFAQPETRRTLDENDAEEEGRHFARVKVEAARARSLRARGRGHLSGLQPGRTTEVFNYPQDRANREYIVLRCDLEITEVGASSGARSTYSVNAEFELQPATEYFRLPQVTPKPRISHFERAVIVTPRDYEMFIDDRNRARIKFSWDRSPDFEGHNSIWVRLGMQWQGGEMGTVFHARGGEEVLVGYEEGDCDRPFIAHFVVNKFNTPAWKLPDNQALSGVVTKSLKYGRTSNHLALDDTYGKQQAQLASDHGKSSLSVGYNTRIDGHAGRQDARGEGFELRTDLWGVVRAAMGLLLTSWGRSGAAGKVKELAEAIAQLTRARAQHEDLSQLSQQHNAQTPHASQADVTRTIKTQNDALRGRAARGTDDFPELTRPDMVIASAAGIATTATDSTHMASHNDHAVTAGRDVSYSAGRSYHVAARGTVSLFAYQQGMKFIAAKGAWVAQAQSGPMSLTALDDVTISSSNGEVIINAAKRVLIGAGGSYIDISGSGITNGSPGPILEKTALWDVPGADTRVPHFPPFGAGTPTDDHIHSL